MPLCAGADEAGKERCCRAVIDTLHCKGHQLLGSGLVPGLIAAIGHLLSAVQVLISICRNAIAILWQIVNYTKLELFFNVLCAG